MPFLIQIVDQFLKRTKVSIKLNKNVHDISFQEINILFLNKSLQKKIVCMINMQTRHIHNRGTKRTV